MPYIKNGQTKYSQNERYNYLREIADSGFKDGIEIPLTERVDYAQRALKVRNRRARFAKSANYVENHPFRKAPNRK